MKKKDKVKAIVDGLSEQEKILSRYSFASSNTVKGVSIDANIPQLSWLGVRDSSGYTFIVGRSIEEINNGWLEGVWNGDFSDLSTALGSETYGSGFYINPDKNGPPTFIQRKDTREFTFIVRDRSKNVDFISNSLAFALASAGVNSGHKLFQTLSKTLVDSTFSEGKLGFHGMNPLAASVDDLLFFRICYSNFSIQENGEYKLQKDVDIKEFSSWDEYENYLLTTTRQIFKNATDRRRVRPLSLLTSVSQGYDSSAVSAIAKACGCDESVTLDAPGDNGKHIADCLGLNCTVFPHIFGKTRRKGLKRPLADEIRPKAWEFIASAGIGDDVVFTSFESALEGKLFLTGIGGDGNWANDGVENLGLKRNIPQNASITEFRLRVGFAHYPPILSGSVSIESIKAISASEEMQSYCIGGEYDRPISRRILEQMGVPRHYFGQKKRAQNPFFTNRESEWNAAMAFVQKRYQAGKLNSTPLIKKKTTQTIDIVIPWVDGADISLNNKRRYFLDQDPHARSQGADSDASSPSRWQDCQELKICISSIEKFAPWVNRVYVITDDQELPGYLPQNFVKEKVALLDHRDTFRGLEEYLPTFNSASIATSTINIPGLSDKYLLFNDDCFFCKPVLPTMFFDGNGKSVLRGRFGAGQNYQKSLNWNIHMNNGARLAGFDEMAMFRLAHCCQPIDKTLVEDFREQSPEIFNKNMSYRFRHRDQFTISSLSAHLALNANRAVIQKEQDWVHMPAGKISRWSTQEIASQMMLLKHEKCYIGNINDLKAVSAKVDIAIPFLEEMVCTD